MVGLLFRRMFNIHFWCIILSNKKKTQKQNKTNRVYINVFQQILKLFVPCVSLYMSPLQTGIKVENTNLFKRFSNIFSCYNFLVTFFFLFSHLKKCVLVNLYHCSLNNGEILYISCLINLLCFGIRLAHTILQINSVLKTKHL